MKRAQVDALCCAMLVGACLAVALPRFLDGIDLPDEGFLAYGAARVLDGQLPHRDFVSLQPPLSFYTTAAAFELLGISLTSMRVLGLGLYLATVLLVYGLGRQLARPLPALLAALPACLLGMPYFDFVPFAVWHGVPLCLAAAILVVRASSSPTPGAGRATALAAGFVSALALLARHDQGVYLGLAVLVFALALHRRTRPAGEAARTAPHWLALWAAGLALGLVPVGLAWLGSGTLDHAFEQLVVFPLSTYAGTSSLPMPEWDSGRGPREQILFALFYVPPLASTAVAVGVAALGWRRRFDEQEARLAFVVSLSLLFYAQVLVRSDVDHLLITLPPFFALCAWLLERALGRSARALGAWRGATPRAALASRLLVLLPLFAVLSWAWPPIAADFLRTRGPEARAIELDRAGVRVRAGFASYVESLVEQIQQHAPAERTILSLPYQPMFYFLAARHNPTRWNYLWPGDQTLEDQREFIRQARRDEPAVALVFQRARTERFAPVILRYLDEDFERVTDTEELSVYLPRSRSAAGGSERRISDDPDSVLR